MVAALPGGVTAAEVARDAGAIVVGAPVLPGAGNGDSAADDARLRQERKDAGITAILHESAPVRFWDHDLGPDQPRLFAVDPDQVQETEIGWAGGDKEPALADDTAVQEGAERAANPARLRDLTPEPGRALDGEAFELTPDGASVITGWWQWDPAGESHCELVMIDVASGKRRVLLSVPEYDFDNPRVSPDGRYIACLRERHATGTGRSTSPWSCSTRPTPRTRQGPGPAGRDLLAGWDRWPHELAWAHDSSALYFTADDGGRCPVFRVDVGTGEVTRVTTDDGAYTDLNPAPDGRYLYALRAAVDSPPTPVRIDLTTGAEPGALDCPGVPVTLPGRLEEVTAAAEDGQPVRAWLVLPEAASADHPAPLLLWVHGGPMSSWNTWSWRWNPWLMAARGYAVLLPDPALSTGYGLGFIARAHRAWGAAPYTDLMAVTDAALARPDIDADPHGDDGRLVRRLHGELDRRPHRPVPGDRQPRRAVGAGPDVRHHRPRRRSGGGSSATR